MHHSRSWQIQNKYRWNGLNIRWYIRQIRFENSIESDGRFDSRFDSNAKKTICRSLPLMRYRLECPANRYVFKSRLNCSESTAGSLRQSGSEFQTVGLATEIVACCGAVRKCFMSESRCTRCGKMKKWHSTRNVRWRWSLNLLTRPTKSLPSLMKSPK